MPGKINLHPRATDARFQRSLNALHAATVEFVEARPLAEISITALVHTAGVTRPTFYQHFADIPDAARRAALGRLDAAVPLPRPLPSEGLSQQALRQRVVDQAMPALKHLAEHRAFYLNVLDGAANAAFFQEIVSFIAGRMLPEVFETAARKGNADRRDLMAVVAGGVMWLVVGWLRDEHRDEPSAMAQRVAGIATALVRTED